MYRADTTKKSTAQVVPSTGIEKDPVGVNVQSSLPVQERAPKCCRDTEEKMARAKGFVAPSACFDMI